ncbi:hypothetical protein Tco_1503082 [Tanacetum coccineum]
MSDSEDSTVTYTEIPNPYEDPSDMGSPGVEGPIFQDPPSPDYVPGPKEPEQAPPSPIYVPFVPEPVYPEFLLGDDEVFPAEEQTMPAADSPTHQSPGYIPESDPEEDLEEDDEEDPEEDPVDYPADRGDDDDDDAEEEEHLAPADPAAVAYSVDQDLYLAYRRDELPSLIHETEMPEMWLPLRKRLCRTTPGPGYEVGESSAAGTARQVGPTTARANLYRFAEMLDAAPGCRMSRELGYGIRDTWDDLVGSIQEIAPTTLDGVNQRVIELSTTARLSRAAWARSMDACDQVHSEGISLRTTVMAQQSEITELQAADRRRQAVITDLLKADYRRQRQLVETLKIVKSLKAQMTELQRQQGPAKDPAEPELPEEASSST